MPSLGADMETGTLTRWLVKPGDTVKRGDIVAEVDTDKATMEAEIFESGIITELLVAEGDRVPVGTVLAMLQPIDGEVPAPAAAPAAPRAAPAPGIAASPLARRTAAKLGVDLSTVRGTGQGGAIRREDVEAAAKQAAVAPVPAKEAEAPAVEVAVPAPAEAPAAPPAAVPAAQAAAADRRGTMRLAIGALMARSKREVPHYYVGSHIDVSRALAWMEEQNLERKVADRLVAAVLLLKATALAAREIPQMNGFWVDGAFQPADGVHLGVAISIREGGLIAPAMHDVDAKSLDEVMADLKGLVERARTFRLRSSEMSDPTLTVTNLGDSGVETVYGVIYAPQVALVGFGKIVERPWAEKGMIGARRVVHATLSADHRASDGHTGARFLAAIDRHLQEPETL